MPEEIQILKEIQEIKEILIKKNEPKILYVKDVAKIMGININKANELWYRDDFPAINIGQKKVEQNAFYNWLQKRRN